MWHNLQRFTLGAITLASLSLVLFGCGTGSAPTAPDSVSKLVTAYDANHDLASNATITASIIDANGNRKIVASGTSDGWGQCVLKIPVAYSSNVTIEETFADANVTVGPSKSVAKHSAQTTIRAFLATALNTDTVTLDMFTEVAYQYVIANKNGVFNANTASEANSMANSLKGLTQTLEDLTVISKAINNLLQSGQTVTLNGLTHKIDFGKDSALSDAIDASIIELKKDGTIPQNYIKPIIDPLAQSGAGDQTAPVGPTALTYDGNASTYKKVVLNWNAATDNVKVTAYNIYRNGDLMTVLDATVRTYTDNTITSATSYTYAVRARDAAGNLADGSTVNVTTKPLPTFTISGKVTLNGSPLSAVTLILSGVGNGSTKTDANGNYTFSGVREGSYTITPAATGGIFNPDSRVVVVSLDSGNVANQDFATTQSGYVNGGTTYPDGTVTVTSIKPDGTVTITATYPDGTVSVVTQYPNGIVTVATTYPSGAVTSATNYPDGTSTVVTTYPNGTITTATNNPDGTSVVVTTYPDGTVTTVNTYADGSIVTLTTYPNGEVVTSTTNPSGSTIKGGVTYPTGSVSTTLGYYVIVYGSVTGTGTSEIDLTFTDTTATPNTITTVRTSIFGTYYFRGLPAHTYAVARTGKTFTPATFMVTGTGNFKQDLVMN